MQVRGYTSDELKLFHRVLDAAMGEAASRDIKLALHTMTQRLFDAAITGERDPERLKAAILHDELAVPQPPISPVLAEAMVR